MYRRCLTEQETAMYIGGMRKSYLRQDRSNGFRKGKTSGPDFIKIGRSIRYLK